MAAERAATAEIAGLKLAWTEFPDLSRCHRLTYPLTAETEDKGAALVHGGFADAAVDDFVRSVCNWGGYAGIAQRVLTENSLQTIGRALNDAYVQASAGQVVEGLLAIMKLKQLGTTSFASKHLRFLKPQAAVILDSVISEQLGYAMNAAGYRGLLADCARLAAELAGRGIRNPARNGGVWHISDVEAAIFAKLRGL